MFNHVKDRDQEVDLLKFAKREAACNKHNIKEAMKLEPDYKKDGSIHKTKTAERKATVNRWKKEMRQLKEFFVKRQYEGSIGDYVRYSYRREYSESRGHLKDHTSSTREGE